MKCIIDGRYLAEDHRLAWREAIIVSDTDIPQDAPPTSTMVDLLIPPVGRERKAKTARFPACWLLNDNDNVRTELAKHGIEVPVPNGRSAA